MSKFVERPQNVFRVVLVLRVVRSNEINLLSGEDAFILFRIELIEEEITPLAKAGVLSFLV